MKHNSLLVIRLRLSAVVAEAWGCIYSQPNSLRLYARADPNMGDIVQREHPQN